MSPEFKIPCLIQCVDGLVLLFQPYAESFLTVLAVAFSAVLVADVPADYMRIGSVACGQLIDKGGSVFLKDEGIRAGIVAVSEFMMASLISPLSRSFSYRNPALFNRHSPLSFSLEGFRDRSGPTSSHLMWRIFAEWQGGPFSGSGCL